MRSAWIYMCCMLLIVSCGKYDTPVDTPNCISAAVPEFAKNAQCDDAAIEEYAFQGTKVYVFDPGTCGADMLAPVNDAECNHLGDLGGFAGNTTINGESFSHAVFIRTIWKAD